MVYATTDMSARWSLTNHSIVLFRGSLAEEGEEYICSKYFDTVNYRSEIDQCCTVVGRYSVLPYYKELERDIYPGKLINSYKEHKWIADFEYYKVLKDVTPETWDDTNFYSCKYPGPFVVKGLTNSKKNQWSRCMFAPTKRDALRIGGDLIEDQYIGQQGVIYRKYIPLETYEIGINNLPFTNEWRVFCYKDQILSYGYYWSIATDNTIQFAKQTGGIDQGIKFVESLLPKIMPYVNFYVVDIARTLTGEWIVIELNDGQMSGLSENDPDELYGNLAKVLK